MTAALNKAANKSDETASEMTEDANTGGHTRQIEFKTALTVSFNRGKHAISRWLLRLASKHHPTEKVVRKAYRRYEKLKLRREFNSRINSISPDEYLDVSARPNLNVVLLVVDALRNSRLSSQGYFRETTPFLDSFKTKFVAISASPWTYPSVPSILTGSYPHNHSAVLAGKVKAWNKYETYLKLRSDIITLPEIFFFLGHRIYFGTAIYPAYWALRGRVVPEVYDPSTRADDLLNDLATWIDKDKRKRFFAYVHLADLHEPLNPPTDFRNFFGDVKNLPNIDRWDFETFERQRQEPGRFQEYKENRELLYDNTLRYVDCAIERFNNSLKNMGLVESTVFIVTADHGQHFWEHAELEASSFYSQTGVYGIAHGESVVNEVIQVPLLLSGPVPQRTPTFLVSTVDIVPTVAELLGIAHSIRFDGQNFFNAEGERPLLSEGCSCGYEKKALVVGRYKLVYSKDDGIEWLFDLENDPEEQHPIVDKGVTSVFVDKLLHMMREDEARKIREIARRRVLQRVHRI